MDTTNFETQLAELENDCPCRKQQIFRLAELLGAQGEFACPNIFVHGNTSTGKSHVLTNMMKIFKLNHAVINCVECYSTRLMYETILESIYERSQLADRTWRKCDNMNDFLRHLKQLLNILEGKFVIIFENAERLRKMDTNLLTAILRLAELVKMNVCVIMVTEIAWQKFLCGTCFPTPIIVHFNNYSQKELIEIMSLDCPDGYKKDFFACYCCLLVSVFHLACRDLNELRHMALLNFTKYCQPLIEDSEMDSRKLWRNIEPHLKRCLSTVYSGEVSSIKWEQMQQQDVSEINKQKIALELPYFSKYLIIAAYFASHNPSRTDRRFFCKRTYGKMSKRAKNIVKKTAADEKLTGPKAFPLDRLMAIFYSIIDDDIDSTSSILTQVSTLVTLNLIAKISADDQIDAAKFKCLVSLDFIHAIADNIGFDLAQYMYEEA